MSNSDVAQLFRDSEQSDRRRGYTFKDLLKRSHSILSDDLARPPSDQVHHSSRISELSGLEHEEEKRWRNLRKNNHEIAKQFAEKPTHHITHRAASRINFARERAWFNLNRIVENGQITIVSIAGGILVAICGIMYGYFIKNQDTRVKGSTTFWDNMWIVTAAILDPGVVAGSSSDDERIILAVVAIVGVLYMSVITGFVVDKVIVYMHALRRGDYAVIVSNHHLILGWNQVVLEVVKNLCEAMKSNGGGVIVILALEKKEEMDAAVRSLGTSLKGTIVHTRHGDPMVKENLEMVRSWTAKSIVLLSPNRANCQESDAQITRSLLSLRGLDQDLNGHIVAEMDDEDAVPVAKMVSQAFIKKGEDEKTPQFIIIRDVVNRIMVQSLYEPGLTRVWTSLLGFDDCEIYLKKWDQLDQHTFSSVQTMFNDAVPIGVLRWDTDEVIINPPGDYVVSKLDDLIVIAEDNDSYAPTISQNISFADSTESEAAEREPTRLLICCWREHIDSILRLLDFKQEPNSQVFILSVIPIVDRVKSLKESGFFQGVWQNLYDVRDAGSDENEKLLYHHKGGRITVTHILGDSSKRRALQELEIENYNEFMILADERLIDKPVQCDSNSLATLLAVSDYAHEKLGGKDPSKIRIVTEIIDMTTQELMSQDPAMQEMSDFMMTSKISADILAMVAESPRVLKVLEKLLAAKGTDLSIRKFGDFCEVEDLMNFWDVSSHMSSNSVMLIGWWRKEDSGPMINPKRKHEMLKWNSEDDRLILMCRPPDPTVVDLITAGDGLRKAAEKIGKKLYSEVKRNETKSKTAIGIDLNDKKELEKFEKNTPDVQRYKDKMNQEAIKSYDAAIKLDKSQGRAMSYYGKGVAYKKLGDWENAREALQKSLDLDPSGTGGRLGKVGGVKPGAVHDNIAQALTKLKKYDDALKAYNCALHENPGFKKFVDGKKKLIRIMDEKISPQGLKPRLRKDGTIQRSQTIHDINEKFGGDNASYDLCLVFPADKKTGELSQKSGRGEVMQYHDGNWYSTPLKSALSCVKAIKKTGLETMHFKCEDEKCVYVIVGATVDWFAKKATQMKVIMPLNSKKLQKHCTSLHSRSGGKCQNITLRHDQQAAILSPFENIHGRFDEDPRLGNLYTAEGSQDDDDSNECPFTAIQKIRMVRAFIETPMLKGGACLPVQALINENIILAIYPLHETEELEELDSEWFPIHIMPWQQPISKIRNYFGESIAIFYAFYGHYMSWLVPLALIGLGFFIYLCAYGYNFDDAKYTSLMGIFTALWCLLMMETWKRREANLAFQWGTHSVEEKEDLIHHNRPLGGELVCPSPIDGTQMIHFPKSHRFPKIAFSIFGVSCFVITTLLLTAGCAFLENYINERYCWGIAFGPAMVAVLNTFGGILLDSFFTKFATYVTESENWPTTKEYNNYLILKLVVFRFINTFGLLYFYGIVRPSVGKCLNHYCGVKSDGQVNRVSIWSHATDAKPYAEEHAYSHGHACMKTLSITLFVKFGTSTLYSLIIKYLISWLRRLTRKKYHSSALSQLERERLLDVFDVNSKSIDSYSNLLIQYGFMILFVTAFPLAPLVGWILNFFEIRAEAQGMCYNSKRAYPLGGSDIDVWYSIFTAVSLCGFITNAAVVCFSLSPTSTEGGIHNAWSFIFLQYAGILVLLLGVTLNPKDSKEIKIQLQRQKYLTSKIIDLEPDIGRESDEGKDELYELSQMPTEVPELIYSSSTSTQAHSIVRRNTFAVDSQV